MRTATPARRRRQPDPETLMTDYVSNIGRSEAAKLLAGAKRVLVTSHVKPDGDAFGSVVAVAAALRSRGAEVTALVAGPVHASFKRLAGFDLIEPYDPDGDWPEVDLVAVLDTGAWAQLGPMRRNIEPRLERTLIIDHHVSGDVPAAWRYIDSIAAAACQILGDLLGRLSADAQPTDAFDPVVAEALYVGLASDTGWFRFSNTRPDTLEMSARLLRAGVDHASLYRKLEQTERIEKLKLLTCALKSLHLLANGRAALMVLHAEDFRQTGAALEETERFVDLPQIVATVEVVVLATEPPPDVANLTGDGNGAIRLSFRSKPGASAVNVARLAQQFGGGGHERAAGAKVVGTLDEVVGKVTRAVASALAEQAAGA